MGAEGSYEVGANRRWQGTGIPSGTGNRPASRAAPGAVAGMQGAKPLAKDNLESPPSPEGKGGGGMGAKKVIQELGKPPGTKTANTQKATPPTQKFSKPLDKQGKVWYTNPAMKRSCLASTAPPQSASGQYPIPDPPDFGDGERFPASGRTAAPGCVLRGGLFFRNCRGRPAG